jgi:hypothetical protein
MAPSIQRNLRSTFKPLAVEVGMNFILGDLMQHPQHRFVRSNGSDHSLVVRCYDNDPIDNSFVCHFRRGVARRAKVALSFDWGVASKLVIRTYSLPLQARACTNP